MQIPMHEFEDPAEAGRWVAADDVVMGGRSMSGLKIEPGGIGVFSGTVSLEDGGGFASVRSAPRDYGIEGCDGLMARVRGDGARYRLRVRTDATPEGVGYQYGFDTRPGAWTIVRARFADFVASRRGRVLPGFPRLEARDVRVVGFLIADRQAGAFRLEIDWIRAYSDAHQAQEESSG